MRSSTTPASSTATPSLRTHPRAWWAAPSDVGPQHDLVERLARRHRRPPPSRRRDRGRDHRAAGDRTVTGRSGPAQAGPQGLEGGHEDRRLDPPRPPQVGRDGRARDRRPPRPRRPGAADGAACTQRSRSTSPGCGPPARRRCRRAGHRRRWADAWARSARRLRGRTRPAPADPSRRPADGPPPATGEVTLPPKAPPLASGVTGSPPGTHHDASGSR